MTTSTQGIISLKEKKSNTNITGTIVLNGTYTSDVNNGGSDGCCSNNYAYEDTTGNVFVRDRFDAFDRLRVSNINSLFEVNSIFNKNHFIDELTSGSGTSTHNSTNSYIEMTVADTGVGKVVRQSYEYIPYQPGKSRLMILTGVMEISGGVEGSVSRIGSFDSAADKTEVTGEGNGLFFELNGTTMYVVERLNSTDTKISQANWNIDKLDGTGPSGYTINNWGYAYIYVIDQEWLGVGMVRFGLFINGSLVPVHVLFHTGLGTPSSSPITQPYTKMAKLPVRYEIQSTSAVNAEMRMICATVVSEGGYEPIGYNYSYMRETVKSIPTTGNTPLFSIKLIETNGSEYNRISLLLKKISILNTDNNKTALYKLYVLQNKNALTGASWTNVDTFSAAQIDISATAVNLTNARLVKSDFVTARNENNIYLGEYINNPLINSHIDGTSLVFCITCRGIGGTTPLYASADWLEIL